MECWEKEEGVREKPYSPTGDRRWNRTLPGKSQPHGNTQINRSGLN